MSIHKFLGTELPIIQAPMAGAQGSAMAIAVSKAGGLGSLPGAMFNAETLRKELSAIRSATDKSYNVNFFCHKQPSEDQTVQARWRQALAPYYKEFGVSVADTAAAPSRKPFSSDVADILEEFRPPIVSFHFGLPEDALLQRVKNFGSKILSTATTVEEAQWLEKKGVDAIIAQGVEAGGHRGFFMTSDLATQIPTQKLVQDILKVTRVPVIAAGGITEAKGVATAIADGAAGVQLGTAYLLCPESTISPVYRAALAADGIKATELTNLFSGGVARGIINRAMKELGPINKDAPPFPLASAAIAPLKAKAEAMGLGDFSSLWSGQNNKELKTLSAFDLTLMLAAEWRQNS